MVLTDEVSAVKAIVGEHIRGLLAELQDFQAGQNRRGVPLFSETRLHMGDTPQVFGYVEYWPHEDPDEEPIDAGITVDLANETVHLTADIYWGDGQRIADISKLDLPYASLGELTHTVDDFAGSMRTELLAQMKVLMASDLVRHYRPYRT